MEAHSQRESVNAVSAVLEVEETVNAVPLSLMAVQFMPTVEHMQRASVAEKAGLVVTFIFLVVM